MTSLRPEQSPLSYNQLIESIGKFVETSIHVILHARQVYPNDLFAQRQMYECQVSQSRNPRLNAYIADTVAAVKMEIGKSTVKEVILIIASVSRETVFERYRFGLDYILNSLPGSSTAGVPNQLRDIDIVGNFTQRELEVHFRRFILQLTSIASNLAPLPENDLTFRTVIELEEAGAPGSANPQQPVEGSWVPAEDAYATGGVNPRSKSPVKPNRGKGKARQLDDDQEMENGDTRLTAQRQTSTRTKKNLLTVSSLDSGVINLNLFVEENVIGKLSHDKSYSRGDYSQELDGNSDFDSSPFAASRSLNKPRDLDEPEAFPTPTASKKKTRRKADGTIDEADSENEGGDDQRYMGSPGDFDGYGGN